MSEDNNLTVDKKIDYNSRALALINLSENDTLTRYNLYCVSYKFYSFGKIDYIKSTADKLMYLSLKSKDTLNIGRANRNLGLYHMSISDNEKAIEYFFKAKKIFESLGRNDYVIKTMHNIALTQFYASDFLGSNRTSFDLMSLSKKANFVKMNPSALSLIGNNLHALKNSNQAIVYYKKVEKATSDKNGIYNNLSSCYIDMRQYDSAKKYVNKNLDSKNLIVRDPINYSIALSLNALICLKTNDYAGIEEKFKLADSYLTRFNSPYGRNYNQIFLSMYYEKKGNKSKATKAAEKALSLSLSYKNPSDILASLKQLIKVDPKNAPKNAIEYIRINDSMQVAERRFRDKFARIEYETDELQQDKETAIKQKWIITGVAGLFILIAALLLIITKQRSKQKELLFLQLQQRNNEEIYNLMLTQKGKEESIRESEKKRIAIELHDGVMNKLASTRLNLNILSYRNDKQTIERCLTYVDEIYNIEQEIRRIAHDLNTDVFNKGNGFETLIKDFINTQNNISNTFYSLDIDESVDWNLISSTVKMNLYRIIQEASHNINKFSGATKAVINLRFDRDNIHLSITDDGKGFEIESKTEGMGLKNIRQRIEGLSGKLNIQSIKNKRTSLDIAIPINSD
ncbi:tetratricopeptide repeat-containing sensor histidine kinase [Flavobacterium sp.]